MHCPIKPSVKVAILIPAFNEEKSIAATFQQLEHLDPEIYEVVVINDGSQDETYKKATQAPLKLKRHVLNLDINLGIGGAVQTGYQFAKQQNFDVALQFDADGQHPGSEVETLLNTLTHSNADMVIGSRFLHAKQDRGYTSTQARILGIRWFCFFISLLCGKKVTDPTSGFRAVNRRLLDRFSEEYPSDYPEPETLASILAARYQVIEVPVKMHPRKAGSSSIRLWKSFYYMVKVSLGIGFGVIASYSGSNGRRLY